MTAIDRRFLRAFRVGCAAALLSVAAESAHAQAPGSARPLSLDAALSLAEAANENVGIARAAVRRAEGLRREARAGYFPQLSGTASYTRTIESQFDIAREGAAPIRCTPFAPQPGLAVDARVDSLERAVQCISTFGVVTPGFESLPFGRPNAYNFGLSFSQTLFNGGRTSGQSHAASAALEAARLGLTATRAQLLLDVAAAYYDAVLGDRLVAIAEATLEQADTTLGQTRLAYQVGNQSEFELLRARVARDNQRPVVIQRRADRDIAYLRLKQLLNLALDEPLVLTTPLSDTAGVGAEHLAALVETPGDTALEGRAPVRQAGAEVESQRGLLRAARGERWPSLVVTSSFAQIAYPSSAFPGGRDFLTDWAVGVGLSVPLFTGGRIGGAVDAARAELVQAELRLARTRELAQLDARQALLQLEAATAAWAASQGTVEQAARAYQIAELRYREGLSTQTELLDARIQRQQAEANRAQAARDLQVARMRVALLPALPLSSDAGAPTGTLQGVPPVLPTPIAPRPPRPLAPSITSVGTPTSVQAGAASP